MDKLLLLLFLFTMTTNTNAQEAFVWPLKELDTAREVSYLSEQEKDIVLEMNMLRYNPAMYAQQHMQWMEAFYSGKLLKIPGKTPYQTEEGRSALQECLKVLKQASPAPILYPSNGMTKACELLVYDQGNTGKTGHRGSDNSTPDSRLNRFGTFTGYFAENIHYGDAEPRFIIISLLIDDGVRSRGHRNTLLSADYHHTGVATGAHKYGEMCVINYASSFTEKH
ncbi:CAP domain-containing protein [Roseimarinus sediminis]|uniref:CAP domain-containing protein n=1 Tax=Roseimarinus sediminis TaxID=1610899 RepID=UPI003D1D0186